MKELFVPYQESLELKELEFDEDCLGHYINKDFDEDGDYSEFYNVPISSRIEDSEYLWKKGSNFVTHNNKNNSHISAPLFSQIFKWFRDKYSWIHIINPYKFTAEIWFLSEKVINEKYGDFIPHHHLVDDEGEEISHSSYEEAELGCIRELIEILKSKKDESKDIN